MDFQELDIDELADAMDVERDPARYLAMLAEYDLRMANEHFGASIPDGA